MYTNILIPTDGSELAGKAVDSGIALAAWRQSYGADGLAALS
jgi:nucleotide-binding universal stress UspA family protein